VVAAAVLLAGCQTLQDNPKQAGGTLVGAGLGALAGSQIGSGKGQLAAVALGTLAGAWLGGEVGKSLDNADRLAAQRTTQSSLERMPSGQAAHWRNPDTGNSGTVTPVRTYRSEAGQDCREFEQTINVGGREERAWGRACRDAQGNWKIVQ
jgi:surface antigen